MAAPAEELAAQPASDEIGDIEIPDNMVEEAPVDEGK